MPASRHGQREPPRLCKPKQALFGGRWRAAAPALSPGGSRAVDTYRSKAWLQEPPLGVTLKLSQCHVRYPSSL